MLCVESSVQLADVDSKVQRLQQHDAAGLTGPLCLQPKAEKGAMLLRFRDGADARRLLLRELQGASMGLSRDDGPRCILACLAAGCTIPAECMQCSCGSRPPKLPLHRHGRLDELRCLEGGRPICVVHDFFWGCIGRSGRRAEVFLCKERFWKRGLACAACTAGAPAKCQLPTDRKSVV